MGMQAEALLRAALDLKYLLDIQPEGSLFHPSGQDARRSCAYRQASTLIGQIVGGGLEFAQGPDVMSADVVTVGDIETEHGADVPAGAS